jgi:hypothetical protein
MVHNFRLAFVSCYRHLRRNLKLKYNSFNIALDTGDGKLLLPAVVACVFCFAVKGGKIEDRSCTSEVFLWRLTSPMQVQSFIIKVPYQSVRSFGFIISFIVKSVNRILPGIRNTKYQFGSGSIAVWINILTLKEPHWVRHVLSLISCCEEPGRTGKYIELGHWYYGCTCKNLQSCLKDGISVEYGSVRRFSSKIAIEKSSLP